MDQSKVRKIIQLFANRVESKYKNSKIFLFGSYAKGTNHEESDIDIAVILNDFDDLMNTQHELMKIRRKIDSRIEPHPFRAADFNESNPLAYEIMQHGIVIN